MRSARVPVQGLSGHAGREDAVAVEEPLEIRVGDDSFYVTMRTAGED